MRFKFERVDAREPPSRPSFSDRPARSVRMPTATRRRRAPKTPSTSNPRPPLYKQQQAIAAIDTPIVTTSRQAAIPRHRHTHNTQREASIHLAAAADPHQEEDVATLPDVDMAAADGELHFGGFQILCC